MRTIRVEKFDGSLRYELSPDDTDKIFVDGRLVRKPRKEEKQKQYLFECLICNVVFDSRTGKGKTHMSGHGYSLEGALQLGKARPVSQREQELAKD